MQAKDQLMAIFGHRFPVYWPSFRRLHDLEISLVLAFYSLHH